MESSKKELLRQAGYGVEVFLVEHGKCPFCKRVIHDPESAFRDELSTKEFNISGLCQECQDGFFTETPTTEFRNLRRRTYVAVSRATEKVLIYGEKLDKKVERPKVRRMDVKDD